MELVSNVEVFAVDRSIITAGYPMVADMEEYLKTATVEARERTANFLAKTIHGEGHDNFLCGIIVQFDLNFTLAAWKQMQRYTFVDFVSSTSTMHRIKKMDVRKQCNEWTSENSIKELEEIVAQYHKDPTKDNMLAMYYNIPTGFKLPAGLTTNYRQLKTIYEQRRKHKLPEWREFCNWIETLPYSELITSGTHKKLEQKRKIKALEDENKKLKEQIAELESKTRDIQLMILENSNNKIEERFEKIFKNIGGGINDKGN